MYIGEHEIPLMSESDSCQAYYIIGSRIERVNENSADYHADMDSEMFERWVKEQLLPALVRAYPGKSCVIVQDNASYHSRLKYQIECTILACQKTQPCRTLCVSKVSF